jgi:hypothetical protein
MTGNSSWFTFEDNYADGCTIPVRAGTPSPDSKGWVTHDHFWRRNRIGRKFAFGPIADSTTSSANQLFDDSTNIWHESGQTYHYSSSSGIWYYAQVVTAGQPAKSWSSTHNGQVA